MRVLGLVASLFAIAFVTTPVLSHEVQNGGGAVVVNGTQYELADLHFSSRSNGKLELSAVMSKKLKEIAHLLNSGFASPVLDENSEEFFASYVLSPSVEFHLVDELPENCSAAGLSDSDNFEMIGCTQGTVTWLRVEPYSKLSFVDQAYLIIHERLHAIAPFEPYEVKADFVKTLHYLIEAYFPLIASAQKYYLQSYISDDAKVPSWVLDFQFGENRWDAVNRFSRRIAQLNRLRGGVSTGLYFSRGGALSMEGRCEGSFLLENKVPIPVTSLGSIGCNLRVD